MKNRITRMAAAAALLAAALPAAAQNYSPQQDPDGYYSQSDQRGYYDRKGTYRQMRAEFDATKPSELPESDVTWHHFLQGMLTDM